jgi:hypothetical protein
MVLGLSEDPDLEFEEQAMQQGKEAGIAKVLIAGGPVRDQVTGRLVLNAGMGIVVDSRHVLTCAHVVNTAIGRALDAATHPESKVSIVFPLSVSDDPIEGKVAEWHPIASKPVADVAVIELDKDVPEDVGLAKFARVSQRVDSGLLLVFGYRAGSEEGNHVEAKLMGPTGAGRVQIDGTSVIGAFIQGGYSGASVWDTVHKSVVGMVSATNTNPADRVAYMIPMSILEKAWPHLVVEEYQADQDEAHSSGGLNALFLSLVEEKTVDFIGREYILREVERTIASEAKGVITLVGDPGAGKSAILATYAKRSGCIAYFNIRSQGVVRADQFLEFVCRQLIARHHLPYPSLPADATRDGAFFARLLAEASGKLREGQSLIIAVDALDEVDLSDHPQGANILFLPNKLPKNTYFFVTRRHVTLPWLFHEPEHIIDLRRGTFQDQTREDVRGYIRNAAMQPRLKAWIEKADIELERFVEVLAEKSENNFMYLRYVLPELSRGRYGDMNIEALPSGLENYYEYHWKYMGMTAKPLPRNKIKVVYVLSVARQPVSRHLIADFTTEDALTVQEVLDEWDQFLHSDIIDGQTRYSVYHTSFRDFLHRKDIVQAAGVTITGINKLIADNLWEGLFGEKPN